MNIFKRLFSGVMLSGSILVSSTGAFPQAPSDPPPTASDRLLSDIKSYRESQSPAEKLVAQTTPRAAAANEVGTNTTPQSEGQANTQGTRTDEDPEAAAEVVLARINRKDKLVNDALEKLEAALKRQRPAYNTGVEADTAKAMLAVVQPLSKQNSEILAAYRDMFQHAKSRDEDAKTLPKFCEAAARQYERWGEECKDPEVRKNYQAVADLWRARASDVLDQIKEVLSDYSESTERFLAEYDTFLKRLIVTLQKYPPTTLNLRTRGSILERLKEHVQQLDRLSESIGKWKDVARKQSKHSAASTPGNNTNPPATGGSATVMASATPAQNAYQKEVDEFIKRHAKRLCNITASDLPAIRSEWGSGPIPYYVEADIREGIFRPDGYFRPHAMVVDGIRDVYVREKSYPGITVDRAPFGLVFFHPQVDIDAALRNKAARAFGESKVIAARSTSRR
ncbi:MAG: hypothetical protein U0790_04065 [Isosphaeraceae bacterium]